MYSKGQTDMHSLKSQSTTLGMPQQNNPIAIWAKKLTKGCFFFLNMCIARTSCIVKVCAKTK